MNSKAVGIGIGGIGKILIPVVSVSVSVHVGIGKISNRYQNFLNFKFPHCLLNELLMLSLECRNSKTILIPVSF